jgi:hypothetical protein
MRTIANTVLIGIVFVLVFLGLIYFKVNGLDSLLALVWFLVALLVGYFASQRRNRNFLNWFCVAFFLSPLVGFLLAASSRSLPDLTMRPKPGG